MSERESFTSRLATWIIVSVIAFVALYYLGAMLYHLEVLPQPAKDMFSWIEDNSTFMSLLFCYTAGMFVVLYLARRSSR